MPEGYSVVIPTVGSATLGRAIDSAWSQSRRPDVVVVVGDRVDDAVIPAGCTARVEFVRANRPGVAAARNAGVAAVRSDWVAFLDDDDEWHAEKMARQLAARRACDPVVILTAALVRRGREAAMRPRRNHALTAGDDVLERLYGVRRYGASRTYLPTPSVVVPLPVAVQVPFDEELTVREDVWWMHQVQRLGVPVEQVAEPLVTVHASRRRARRRESISSLAQWTTLLESVDVRFARNFLLGMALRESLLAGDLDQTNWVVRTATRLRSRHG
jgi:glycosyltransferase involved in cell wall biosynthesis